MSSSQLPIAIIGAGPVGLAAAARAAERNLPFVVLEAGDGVGSALREWGHVRVFSPWSFNIDDAAHALLKAKGWQAPIPTGLPTGREIAQHYLEPLAAHPAIAPNIILNARVTRVARAENDKMNDANRAESPFVLRWRDSDGEEHETQARAVIDATGAWTQPNPIGVNGLPVLGEAAAREFIDYGIPNVRENRERFAGKRILVVGGGHSAINVALDLLALQKEAPDTKVFWALRRNRIEKLLGGGINDQLPERGALGLAAMEAIKANRLTMLAPFAVSRISTDGGTVKVQAKLANEDTSLDVDRIVVATGLRPDLDMLRELRVAIDPSVEAPPTLAPLIDPNLHSCGSVPPHGVVELTHPEPNFYIVGSKVYGRAPTFLMATGYEQVRSVIAELAGDHEAARRVELVLPETGVCSTSPVVGAKAAACCGPSDSKEDLAVSTPVIAEEKACCGATA
ncbi:MAG: NAD(P)-binding domain-containing protein [Hyphomonadaceae bacterium]|nr:NAD(P)-binding domain-containing protein [Hyphomonadaceae bacterium]